MEEVSLIFTDSPSWYYLEGWLDQLLPGYWRGVVAHISLICKTLKAHSCPWTSAVCTLSTYDKTVQVSWVYLCLFTETNTARAATATDHTCLLSISCLVTSHSSDLPQKALHLSISFALKTLQKVFQHPKKINRPLQSPGTWHRKSVFLGIRGGDNSRENQQFLCGQSMTARLGQRKVYA